MTHLWQRAAHLTIATSIASGQPHAAVVIGASALDASYFTVPDESALARNLTANGRIEFSECRGAHAVMGQGLGVDGGLRSELTDLIKEVAAATTIDRFTPPGREGLLDTVDLRRIDVPGGRASLRPVGG